MTGPLAFAAWHGYYFSRQYTSMHSMVIVPLQQRPSLAPAPSQGAPGGSGWPGALRREAKSTGRPAAASGAQASHLQTRRCHRL